MVNERGQLLGSKTVSGVGVMDTIGEITVVSLLLGDWV
jgi:hypothetical protein